MTSIPIAEQRGVCTMCEWFRDDGMCVYSFFFFFVLLFIYERVIFKVTTGIHGCYQNCNFLIHLKFNMIRMQFSSFNSIFVWRIFQFFSFHYETNNCCLHWLLEQHVGVEQHYVYGSTKPFIVHDWPPKPISQ